MSVHMLHEWRTPGCGPECWPRAHDLSAHHDHGYSLGYQQAIRDMQPRIVRTGPLVVDLGERQVWVDGIEVPFFAANPSWWATAQWALLDALVRRIGQTVPLETLAQDVLGCAFDASVRHALEMTSYRLRKRLGAARTLITTRPGFGLRLEQEAPR